MDTHQTSEKSFGGFTDVGLQVSEITVCVVGIIDVLNNRFLLFVVVVSVITCSICTIASKKKKHQTTAVAGEEMGQLYL